MRRAHSRHYVPRASSLVLPPTSRLIRLGTLDNLMHQLELMSLAGQLLILHVLIFRLLQEELMSRDGPLLILHVQASMTSPHISPLCSRERILP